MMQTMTMTGKYKRKSVPNTLEVRGISRGGETYTRVLHSTDHELPQEFTDTVNHAISQYRADSERSSPTTAQFLETSNNNWTNLTGNTTDRSSVDSTVTNDDVFDQEASLNVQRLFDDIDSMLFEATDTSGTSSQLYNECKDWSEAFPHLRILGEQLISSSEQGYHVVESRLSSRSISTLETVDIGGDNYNDSPHSADINFGVAGTGIRLYSYSSSSGDTPSSSQTDMSDLTAEVIVDDGYYEDIIAIDKDQPEDVLDSKISSLRQRRSRYPPMTPNACAKDDIVHTVFGDMWTLMTDTIRILLQRYSEHFVITHPMAITAPEEIEHGDGHVKLPQIFMPGSRMDSMILPIPHGNQRLISGSVARQSNYSLNPSHEPLRKLLQINKIEMIERKEKTFLLDDGTDTPMLGQSSLIKKSSGAGNMSANRRLVPKKNVLLPLNDRVRTPNVDDEVLRGQGIAAKIGSRMLPPISHPDPAPQQHSSTQIIKKGNRASSAVAEKEIRLNQREKAAIIAETRPSTTHTIYPTDPNGILNLGMSALQQRSSTPLDKSTSKLRSDLLLGITGSSLIGPNSAVLDEQVEDRYEPTVTHHGQWGAHRVRALARPPLTHMPGLDDSCHALLIGSALGQRSIPESTRHRETVSASHCHGRISSE